MVGEASVVSENTACQFLCQNAVEQASIQQDVLRISNFPRLSPITGFGFVQTVGRKCDRNESK